MKSLSLLIFFIIPVFSLAQLSDELLEKVRQGTKDFYITTDTQRMVGSKTLPQLEVFLNDRGPFNLLIDLGANVTIFKRSVVNEVNAEVLVDRERSDIIKISKFKIGNSVFIDVYGGAYDELDVDGVLGNNLLQKHNFLLDYPEMQFAFFHGEPNANECVPFETIGRMPFLPARVGEKEILINFDTGASLWLYFPYHWKDSVHFITPLTEGRVMYNNQTGSTMTYDGKIKETVTFGNYLLPSPKVVFDPNIEDIYVGSSLLSDFILHFYPKQKMVRMQKITPRKEIYIPE